jgi:Poly(R)-hydroxyalkanoic acid synthase subunit (PHA_synth_III_E)
MRKWEAPLSNDRNPQVPSPPGDDRSSDALEAMRLIGAASADLLSAWTGAWSALLANRGAPVGEAMLQTITNPTAWPTALVPILDEIRSAIKLPTFADLPGADLFQLPSPAPLIGLIQVSQDYATISVPIWIKACERFLAEVKERQAANQGQAPSAGEVMDAWNNVLDSTLMEFNRSGEFAKAQQRLLHAAAQQRRELSGAVEKIAKAIDLPTRSEMTDLYRRLHDLRREVHALRQEIRTSRAAPKPPGRAERDAG